MPERSTADRLKEAREAVMLEDHRKLLNQANSVVDAHYRENGMPLAKDGDEMIVGDVTINTTTDTKQSNGLPKWAGVALAAAGIASGVGALPAAGLVLNYLTKTNTPSVPAETQQPKNGIGIFRPAQVKTAVPARATGITVVSATWCRPCEVYKSSVLDRLKKEGYAIRIVINDSPTHAVPMTYFYEGENVLDNQAGIISYSQLKKVLTK